MYYTLKQQYSLIELARNRSQFFHIPIEILHCNKKTAIVKVFDVTMIGESIPPDVGQVTTNGMK